MHLDKEVLIVGAGPSGLMMACQLLRHGVSFKIIDQQADRAQESRAFGIQAKSMEIFQNLGLANQFLEKAQTPMEIIFYWQRQPKLHLHLDQIKIANTPFSSIYFLPQSETETILINYLAQREIFVDRKIKLENFKEYSSYYSATLRQETNETTTEFNCRYIIGCDGAHSTVRKLLHIPFLGGDYQQDFFLADAKLKWPPPIKMGFKLFLSNQGIFLNAPLNETYSRIITAKINPQPKNQLTPNPNEIQKIINDIFQINLKIDEIQWMSRFRLHHRVVQQYQKNNAFLVGDAAHIHSPVGAQGMNTGLQDATNLAWKIALTIQNKLDNRLLKTYELEREFIGKKLTRTTDRLFELLTSSNPILSVIRPALILSALKIISSFPAIQKKIFWLMSQLGIHYNPNEYIYEKWQNTPSAFLAGPRAGFRAPDSSAGNTSLFAILKEKPANLLFFITHQPIPTAIIEELQSQFKEWLGVHQFFLTNNSELFKDYGVTKDSVYFIRPDGYIGFRNSPLNMEELLSYLKKYTNSGILFESKKI